VDLPRAVHDPDAAFAEASQHLVTPVQLPPDEGIGLWVGIEQIYDHGSRL
jgi:hypothetical protein